MLITVCLERGNTPELDGYGPLSKAGACRDNATVLNVRMTLANFVEAAVMGENRGGG